MSDVLFNLMVKACKIRMDAGEDIESILSTYPKLSESEKDRIREILNQ